MSSLSHYLIAGNGAKVARTNIVYVVGAGASKEAKIPAGHELKNNIVNLLDIKHYFDKQIGGDRLILDAVREYIKGTEVSEKDINKYIDEAVAIKDALPLAISIDNLLDAHRDKKIMSLCGKLAIVRAILRAEKDSLLYFKKDRVDSTINFKRLEQTWYLPFFQVITENCCVENLEERLKSISLIVFNYDRCIEHFLFHAFMTYFRISKEQSSELVGYLNIYHPYGKVGDLTWENKDDPTDFGDEPYPAKLLSLAERIKTFTEGTDPNSSKIASIRDKMENAIRLAFLGFAFHKLNMDVLKSNQSSKKKLNSPVCFATTLGISESDKKAITGQISELYNGARVAPRMTDLKCCPFFTEFRRSLSF